MTAACRPGASCAHGVPEVAGPGGGAGSLVDLREGSTCDVRAPPCWSIQAFAAWQACEYSSSVDSASAPTAVVTPPGETSVAPGAGVCVSELVAVVVADVDEG